MARGIVKGGLNDGGSLILTAGDNYFAGNTVISATTSSSYAKTKEVSINASGTIRVKFDMRTNSTTAYGRIYKNGVAVGVIRQTSSASYITYTEDIAVVAGDLIQIYAMTASGTTYITNLKLYTGIVFIGTTFSVDV